MRDSVELGHPSRSASHAARTHGLHQRTKNPGMEIEFSRKEIRPIFGEGNLTVTAKTHIFVISFSALMLIASVALAIEPGVYEIRPYHISSKCLDVRGGALARGTNIQQWTCVGVANQRWHIRRTAQPDVYEMVAEHSRKCLDVRGGALNNGANVQQWDCVGVANQKWFFRSTARPNVYEIVAEHSGKCLDVRGGELNNGTNVQQWDCAGFANQKWLLHRIY
jgi:hypothetical protein